jgi:hypothetical protein
MTAATTIYQEVSTLNSSLAEELQPEQVADVARSAAIVSALHLEATHIAQRRVGPIDAGEVGAIVIALAAVFTSLTKERAEHHLLNETSAPLPR